MRSQLHRETKDLHGGIEESGVCSDSTHEHLVSHLHTRQRLLLLIPLSRYPLLHAGQAIVLPIDQQRLVREGALFKSISDQSQTNLSINNIGQILHLMQFR